MCNRAIHDTFLSLKNVKKGDIVKKCPVSLYYPLLTIHHSKILKSNYYLQETNTSISKSLFHFTLPFTFCISFANLELLEVHTIRRAETIQEKVYFHFK